MTFNLDHLPKPNRRGLGGHSSDLTSPPGGSEDFFKPEAVEVRHKLPRVPVRSGEDARASEIDATPVIVSRAFASPRGDGVAAGSGLAATPQVRGTDAASAAVPASNVPPWNRDRRTLKVLDPCGPWCRVCRKFAAWEGGLCIRCTEEWTDCRDGVEDVEIEEG